MNLENARIKYLNQYCDVNWNWTEAPKRGNIRDDPTNYTRNVLVTEVYENCHHEVMFRTSEKLTCPFRVERLSLTKERM